MLPSWPSTPDNPSRDDPGRGDDSPSPPDPGRHGRTAVPLIPLVALVALVAVPLAVVATAPDVEAVRAWVAATGPLAAPAFLVAFVLGSVIALPKPVLSVAAGLLFPAGPAVALTVLGSTGGAVLSFLLARRLRRPALGEVVDRPGMRRLAEVLDRGGLVGILLLRLAPVLPFALVNYGAGLLGTRLPPFALGTALGVIPASVGYVLVGDLAAAYLGPPALVAVAVFALTGGAVHLVRRHRRHRRPPPGP
ncbi:TVP38/TMEM64 family protein [Actinoalloteichus sp. AHMU CJ021]|uniref:TVP38/TMEM64 family protein n=1 Tax=Actinoalloteichus sp. AHMU CJ021 TaxID=2072503 RepID=UPI000CA04309|nr:TVP38/TMEM64 family protein [Actinoalloteichus sp. AHMU CJ021]